MVQRDLELELTEVSPLTCAAKEPMLWTAPIKNLLYKATCLPSAVRFVARRLVTLATCTCMYKCTLGKNLTDVEYVGNVVVHLADCRSTSEATQEKNRSAARSVERASRRWLTSRCICGSIRGRSHTAVLCVASASAALTKSKGTFRPIAVREHISQGNDANVLLNNLVRESY